TDTNGSGTTDTTHQDTNAGGQTSTETNGSGTTQQRTDTGTSTGTQHGTDTGTSTNTHRGTNTTQQFSNTVKQPGNAAGGITDQQRSCEKAGRPWVDAPSGGYCGNFNKLGGDQGQSNQPSTGNGGVGVSPSDLEGMLNGIYAGNQACQLLRCAGWSASKASQVISTADKANTVLSLGTVAVETVRLGDALKHANAAMAAAHNNKKDPAVKKALDELYTETVKLHSALIDVFPPIAIAAPLPVR
ncbi:hypothetical protein ACFVVY_51720, partial [Streptomyces mirabilis]